MAIVHGITDSWLAPILLEGNDMNLAIMNQLRKNIASFTT